MVRTQEPLQDRHQAQRLPGQQVMMPYLAEVIEIDIDGRTFWVRPVGAWVLDSLLMVLTQMRIKKF